MSAQIAPSEMRLLHALASDPERWFSASRLILMRLVPLESTPSSLGRAAASLIRKGLAERNDDLRAMYAGVITRYRITQAGIGYLSLTDAP